MLDGISLVRKINARQLSREEFAVLMDFLKLNPKKNQLGHISNRDIERKTSISHQAIGEYKKRLKENPDYNPYDQYQEINRAFSQKAEELLINIIESEYLEPGYFFNNSVLKIIAKGLWKTLPESEKLRKAFKASDEWCKGIRDKYSYVWRRGRLGKRPVANAKTEKIKEQFIAKIANRIVKLQEMDLLFCLVNMDETAWKISYCGDITWAHKGASVVKILSNFNTKKNATVLSACTIDNIKLPPYILGKGKTKLCERKLKAKCPPNLYEILGSDPVSPIDEKILEMLQTDCTEARRVSNSPAQSKTDRQLDSDFENEEVEIPEFYVTDHSESGWCTITVMKRYLKWLRSWYDSSFADKDNYVVGMTKIYLIMDCYSAHRNKSVKKAAKKLNIHIYFIPAGCTDICQPLDVKVFGALKSVARYIWYRIFAHQPDLPLDLGDAIFCLLASWRAITEQTISSAWDAYKKLADSEKDDDPTYEDGNDVLQNYDTALRIIGEGVRATMSDRESKKMLRFGTEKTFHLTEGGGARIIKMIKEHKYASDTYDEEEEVEEEEEEEEKGKDICEEEDEDEEDDDDEKEIWEVEGGSDETETSTSDDLVEDSAYDLQEALMSNLISERPVMPAVEYFCNIDYNRDYEDKNIKISYDDSFLQTVDTRPISSIYESKAETRVNRMKAKKLKEPIFAETVGISNLGASCAFNTALQLIYSLPNYSICLAEETETKLDETGDIINFVKYILYRMDMANNALNMKKCILDYCAEANFTDIETASKEITNYISNMGHSVLTWLLDLIDKPQCQIILNNYAKPTMVIEINLSEPLEQSLKNIKLWSVNRFILLLVSRLNEDEVDLDHYEPPLVMFPNHFAMNDGSRSILFILKSWVEIRPNHFVALINKSLTEESFIINDNKITECEMTPHYTAIGLYLAVPF